MGDLNKKRSLSESPGFKNLKSALTDVVNDSVGSVDSILSGDKNAEVLIDLSNDLLKTLVHISEETGKSFDDIFSQILKSGTEKVLSDSNTFTGSEDEKNKLTEGITFTSLENEVLRFIGKNTTPFSKGTEAEVFKMPIAGNEEEVLLVKRKYENAKIGEFGIHHIAKEIQNTYSENGGDMVHIPTPLHHFNDGKNEYILMEFIKGKTLHLMITESILTNETIHKGKEIEDEELRREFYYYYYNYVNKGNDLIDKDEFFKLSINDILSLLGDKEGYIKNIEFDTDEEGNDAILNLYRILKQAGVKIDFNPDGLIDMGGGNTVNELHKKINLSNLSKVPLFTGKDGENITRELSKFISYMHAEGLYHADLGENARNIMFTKTDDGYKIDIIDFGRSKYFSEGVGDENPYYNDITEHRNTRDEGIIERIRTLGSIEDIKREKLIDDTKENDLNNLLEVGNEFGLSEDSLKQKFNIFYKNRNNKNFILDLKNLLYTRDLGGYKLNLSITTNPNIQADRDSENKILKVEILVLLSFVSNQENDIEKYIDSLELKGPKKLEYIKLYKNMFNKINKN